MSEEMIEHVFSDEQGVRRLVRLMSTRLGINLEGKESLLRQRLASLFWKGVVSDLGQVCDRMEREDTHSAFVQDLHDRVTTHHTYFFREPAHFDRLLEFAKTDRFPGQPLRIWCAACSTGEEAYTIAMVLAEGLGDLRFGRDAAILATDVSSPSVAVAQAGVYELARLNEILPRHRKYCAQVGSRFRIVDGLRRPSLFRRLNLLAPAYPFQNRFDVVFCRNVFIYFDTRTREAVAIKLAAAATKNALLFISHTETLRDVRSPWVPAGPGIYRNGV